jgi:hypothetical protein
VRKDVFTAQNIRRPTGKNSGGFIFQRMGFSVQPLTEVDVDPIFRVLEFNYFGVFACLKRDFCLPNKSVCSSEKVIPITGMHVARMIGPS